MAVLPSWLVPAWNYGAAWTSLFDWNALAALATVSAVGAALWISGREERRASQSAAAADIRLLKALLIVLVNGYDATRKTALNLRLPEYRLTGPGLAKAALHVSGTEEVTRCLETFSPESMPSTTSVDLLMSARVSWQGILDMLKHISTQKVAAHEKLYPDMGEPEWRGQLDDAPWDRVDQVLSAIADEIVRRGGGTASFEDTSVQARIAQAVARQTP